MHQNVSINKPPLPTNRKLTENRALLAGGLDGNLRLTAAVAAAKKGLRFNPAHRGLSRN